LRLPFFK